jgi:hypothetical protein
VSKLSRAEREDLTRVVKLRLDVAKDMVEQRAKELRADVEAKLSAIHRADHAAWADVTGDAERFVAEADRRIAMKCRELGIPEGLRPQLSLGWYGRGESASKERRAELRRTAFARIDALAAAALTQIKARTADVWTDIIAAGLESDAAKQFLASMPTVEQLMPLLPVTEMAAQQMLQLVGMAEEDDDFPDEQVIRMPAVVTPVTAGGTPVTTDGTPEVTAKDPAATDSRNCAHCGRAFTPARSDARYCREACRVAEHRRRQKGQTGPAGT